MSSTYCLHKTQKCAWGQMCHSFISVNCQQHSFMLIAYFNYLERKPDWPWKGVAKDRSHYPSAALGISQALFSIPLRQVNISSGGDQNSHFIGNFTGLNFVLTLKQNKNAICFHETNIWGKGWVGGRSSKSVHFNLSILSFLCSIEDSTH